jgi:hypothetical protein
MKSKGKQGRAKKPARKAKLTTAPGKSLPNAPQRLASALAWLADGQRYLEVRTVLMEKYSISHATAEADIKRAYQVITDEAAVEAPQLAARVSGRLWRVALKAEAAADYSAAVSALARFAKLHGLEAPKNINVTAGVTEEQKQLLAALAMTPADRQRRIAELEGEQGGGVESTP